MSKAKFGPAGNSESFAAEGYKKSEDAPAWLAAKGLTAFEYQCGRGVRCGEDTARKIGAAAKAHGIQMSIHAPYFINLSSEESERMEKNVGYVLETARLAVPLGATRMVVHCGGQGKLTRERAMRNTHENVRNILRAHFSHIEYNDKGEIRHLTFSDTVYGPDFAPVAQETAARGYASTFICESAGTQAEDAVTMMQVYCEEIKK